MLLLGFILIVHVRPLSVGLWHLLFYLGLAVHHLLGKRCSLDFLLLLFYFMPSKLCVFLAHSESGAGCGIRFYRLSEEILHIFKVRTATVHVFVTIPGLPWEIVDNRNLPSMRIQYKYFKMSYGYSRVVYGSEECRKEICG